MEIIKATLVLWILVALIAILAAIYLYFKNLKSSPRNFWLFLIADVFLSFGCGIVVFSLFAYIQSTFGDPGIKIYNFMWIGTMPLLTILLAPFCDAAGLRKTLIYGTFFIILGTFLTPLFNNIYFVLLLGLIPLVIGKAILSPVFNIGIKRYTNKSNITVAFGLFSILTVFSMSAGSFFYSYFEDIFNIKNSGDLFFGHFSIFQILTFASFIFSVPALLMGLFIHEEIKTDNKKILLNFRKVIGDMKNIFIRVIKSRIFWIFIFVIGSLVFVRILFFHFNYLLPKYGHRVFSDKIKIAKIMMINGFVVGGLTIFVPLLTKKIKSYNMLIVGTFVSATSVFIASFPGKIWTGLANSWLGDLIYIKLFEFSGERMPEVVGLVVFIVVFSVGEAIWSPRIAQFTVEMAPEGQESTYLGFSSIPFFMSKFLMGPLAGILLTKYVPLDESGSSLNHYPDRYAVWIWIGIISIITPLLLFSKRKKLQ